MRGWLQAAVLMLAIPVLGEAQTSFLENCLIRPYEAKPVPPVNFGIRSGFST